MLRRRTPRQKARSATPRPVSSLPPFPPSYPARNPPNENQENDNLRDEYSPLTPHLPPSPPFARIALSRAPDALNLWVGNSRSVTALHRDNYENLYVQVRGRKHFVLFPALCAPVARERPLRPARYARREDGGLELKGEEGGDVPFPTWDPDGVSVGGREGGEGEVEVEGNEFEDVVKPLRVTLEPGDMLYLPAMWWVSPDSGGCRAC